MSAVAVKAQRTQCRFCGVQMEAQESSPGRPRVYCSRRCSRAWHTLKEQYRRAAEIDEAHEQRYYAMTRQWWDKRTCDREARRRARDGEERRQARERHLEAPWRD